MLILDMNNVDDFIAALDKKELSNIQNENYIRTKILSLDFVCG